MPNMKSRFISYSSKVMEKIKKFLPQRDGHTHKQTDRQMGQKLDAPNFNSRV